MREYEHPLINEETTSIGGHYTVTKVGKLFYPSDEKRELLYFIGHAVIDTSCCATGLGYAIVPGYIIRWCARKSPHNRAISLVEPVKEEDYQHIRNIIRSKEAVNQIHFLHDSGDIKVIY